MSHESSDAHGLSPHRPTGPTPNTHHPSPNREIVGWAQRNGLFFALVVIVIFFATRSDRYLTLTNLHVVLLQVAVVGIIAVPGAS